MALTAPMGLAATAQNNSRVYILAIVTSMGAFLFGYDLAFIGTSIELDPFKRYLMKCIYFFQIWTNLLKGLRTRWRIRGRPKRIFRQHSVTTSSRMFLRFSRGSTCW